MYMQNLLIPIRQLMDGKSMHLKSKQSQSKHNHGKKG